LSKGLRGSRIGRTPPTALGLSQPLGSLHFLLMKATRPDKFAQLQEEIEQLHQASSAPYEAHPEDVQTSILSMFPTEVVKAVREWERRTGAAIYIITAFRKPDSGPEVFDTWTDWIKEHLGARFSSNPQLALPGIYPDRDGCPLLPKLFSLNLGMDEEKRIMRHYFTGTSQYMGGTTPPYSSLEKQMREDPGRIVERKRMPPTIQILRDPKWWSRKELNAWITHIVKGQKSNAESSTRFQWHHVPVRKDMPQLVA
ncbi:hypothetical protein BDV93DRAFT_594239, partial [Ceratobasidium sp. AG-I]